MEMIFLWRIENLRKSAQDEFLRRELIRKTLQLRGILFWTAFPVVIALVAVAVMLLIHLVDLLKDKSRVSDFFNLTDILYPVVGFLVVFSFASLIAVHCADRRVRMLSTLRDDDPLPDEGREKTVSPVNEAGIGKASGCEGLPRPPETKSELQEGSALGAV